MSGSRFFQFDIYKKKKDHCTTLSSKTYFNNVEDDVLVKAVEDALCHTVVVPGSMDKQQILKVFKLHGTDTHSRKQRGSLVNKMIGSVKVLH